MQYIGIMLPINHVNDVEWIYKLQEDDNEVQTYFVENARNPSEARRKIFTEKWKYEFNSYTKYFYIKDRIEHILEDLNEETIIEKYGKDDGKIIIKIAEFLINSQNQNEHIVSNIDSLIDKIKDSTLFELAFEVIEMEIGIARATIV